MSIAFTQFLRPYGERRPMEIDRPKPIEDAAKMLVASGCRFDIEELTTGQISMTCEHDSMEGALAHEICNNGPPVLDAIDRLVRDAVASLHAMIPDPFLPEPLTEAEMIQEAFDRR